MHFLKALAALAFTSLIGSVLAAPVPQNVTPYSLDLFKRAPTFRFENCTPEQEDKIRDAYRKAMDVAGRLINEATEDMANTLVYRRIFGDRSVVENYHQDQDYDSQVQLVRDNFRRISRLTEDNDAIILWNCDPDGNYKRDKSKKESANTWPEDNGVYRINLFGNPDTRDDGGFLNLPSWEETLVQINQQAGPSSVTGVCTALDILMRTDTAVILHELLHVTGIGMRADGSRIIDQVLDRDTLGNPTRFAYGESGVTRLAIRNPQAAVENADSYAAYLVAVITRHTSYFADSAVAEYERTIHFDAWDEADRAAGRPPTPPPPDYELPGYTAPDGNHSPLDNNTGGTPPPGYGGSYDYLYGGIDPFGNVPGWNPPGSSGGGSGGSYFV